MIHTKICMNHTNYVWIIHMYETRFEKKLKLAYKICMTPVIHMYESYKICMTRFIHKYDSYILSMIHTKCMNGFIHIMLKSYICMNRVIHQYVWIILKYEFKDKNRKKIKFFFRYFVWINSYILYESYLICMNHT